MGGFNVGDISVTLHADLGDTLDGIVGFKKAMDDATGSAEDLKSSTSDLVGSLSTLEGGAKSANDGLSTIKGTADDASSGLDGVGTSAGNAASALDDASGKFSTFASNASDATGNANEASAAIGTLADNVDKVSSFSDAAVSGLNSIGSSITDVGRAATENELGAWIETAVKDLTDAGSTADEVRPKLVDMINAGVAPGAAFIAVLDTISTSVDGVGTSADSTVGMVTNLGASISGAETNASDATGALNDLKGAEEDVSGGAQSAAGELDNLGNKAGETKDKLDDANKSGAAFGQTATDILDAQKKADDELANAIEALAQIKTAYDNGETSAQALARAQNAVEDATKTANPELKTSGDEAETSAGKLKEMAEQLTALGEAFVITEALKEFGTEALKAFGEEQQISISLTQLSGSAEDAAAAMEHLKVTASEAGVSEDAMLNSARALAPVFGVGSGLTGILEASANAAAATGKSLDAVAGSLERVEQTGQVSARQLVSLGLTWQDLATTMGTSIDEAQKKLKKGGQDAAADVQVLLDTVNTKFAGAAEAQGKSLLGMFQALENQVDNLMQDIGAALAPVMGDIMGVVSKDILPAIKSIIEAFNELPGPVKDFALGLGLAALAVIPLTGGLAALSLGVVGIQSAINVLTPLMTTVKGLFEGATVATELNADADIKATIAANELAAAETKLAGSEGIAAVGAATEEATRGIAASSEAMLAAKESTAIASEAFTGFNFTLGLAGIALVSLGTGALLAWNQLEKGLEPLHKLDAGFATWIKNQLDSVKTQHDAEAAQDKLNAAIDAGVVSAKQAQIFQDELNGVILKQGLQLTTTAANWDGLSKAQQKMLGTGMESSLKDMGISVTGLGQSLTDSQAAADGAAAKLGVLKLNIVNATQAQKDADVAYQKAKSTGQGVEEAYKRLAKANEELSAATKAQTDAENQLDPAIKAHQDQIKKLAEENLPAAMAAQQKWVDGLISSGKPLSQITDAIDAQDKMIKKLAEESVPRAVQAQGDWIDHLNATNVPAALVMKAYQDMEALLKQLANQDLQAAIIAQGEWTKHLVDTAAPAEVVRASIKAQSDDIKKLASEDLQAGIAAYQQFTDELVDMGAPADLVVASLKDQQDALKKLASEDLSAAIDEQGAFIDSLKAMDAPAKVVSDAYAQQSTNLKKLADEDLEGAIEKQGKLADEMRDTEQPAKDVRDAYDAQEASIKKLAEDSLGKAVDLQQKFIDKLVATGRPASEVSAAYGVMEGFIKTLTETDLPKAVDLQQQNIDKLNATGGPAKTVADAYKVQQGLIKTMADEDLPKAITAQKNWIDELINTNRPQKDVTDGLKIEQGMIQALAISDLPGAIKAQGDYITELTNMGRPLGEVIAAQKTEQAMIQDLATRDLPAAITAQKNHIQALKDSGAQAGIAQAAEQTLDDMYNKLSKTDLPAATTAIGNQTAALITHGGTWTDVAGKAGEYEGMILKLAKTDLPDAIKAQQDYIDKLKLVGAPQSDIIAATKTMDEMEIQLAKDRGEGWSKFSIDLVNIQQKLKDQADSYKNIGGAFYTDFVKVWNDGFDSLGKSLADNLVAGKSWADTWHSFMQGIEKEITEELIGTVFKALRSEIDSLVGSLIGTLSGALKTAGGGISGLTNAALGSSSSLTNLSGALNPLSGIVGDFGKTAGDAGKAAGDLASSASKGASGIASSASGLISNIGGISSAVSAVTGVIGVFQAAAAEATNKLIEQNTRISAIVQQKELPLANEINVEQENTFHDISTFTSFIPDISTHTANLPDALAQIVASLGNWGGLFDRLDGIYDALGAGGGVGGGATSAALVSALADVKNAILGLGTQSAAQSQASAENQAKYAADVKAANDAQKAATAAQETADELRFKAAFGGSQQAAADAMANAKSLQAKADALALQVKLDLGTLNATASGAKTATQTAADNSAKTATDAVRGTSAMEGTKTAVETSGRNISNATRRSADASEATTTAVAKAGQSVEETSRDNTRQSLAATRDSATAVGGAIDVLKQEIATNQTALNTALATGNTGLASALQANGDLLNQQLAQLVAVQDSSTKTETNTRNTLAQITLDQQAIQNLQDEIKTDTAAMQEAQSTGDTELAAGYKAAIQADVDQIKVLQGNVAELRGSITDVSDAVDKSGKDNSNAVVRGNADQIAKLQQTLQTLETAQEQALATGNVALAASYQTEIDQITGVLKTIKDATDQVAKTGRDNLQATQDSTKAIQDGTRQASSERQAAQTAKSEQDQIINTKLDFVHEDGKRTASNTDLIEQHGRDQLKATADGTSNFTTQIGILRDQQKDLERLSEEAMAQGNATLASALRTAADSINAQVDALIAVEQTSQGKLEDIKTSSLRQASNSDLIEQHGRDIITATKDAATNVGGRVDGARDRITQSTDRTTAAVTGLGSTIGLAMNQAVTTIKRAADGTTSQVMQTGRDILGGQTAQTTAIADETKTAGNQGSTATKQGADEVSTAVIGSTAALGALVGTMGSVGGTGGGSSNIGPGGSGVNNNSITAFIAALAAMKPLPFGQLNGKDVAGTMPGETYGNDGQIIPPGYYFDQTMIAVRQAASIAMQNALGTGDLATFLQNEMAFMQASGGVAPSWMYDGQGNISITPVDILANLNHQGQVAAAAQLAQMLEPSPPPGTTPPATTTAPPPTTPPPATTPSATPSGGTLPPADAGSKEPGRLAGETGARTPRSGFATGAYFPFDLTTQVHAGEVVVPAAGVNAIGAAIEAGAQTQVQQSAQVKTLQQQLDDANANLMKALAKGDVAGANAATGLVNQLNTMAAQYSSMDAVPGMNASVAGPPSSGASNASAQIQSGGFLLIDADLQKILAQLKVTGGSAGGGSAVPIAPGKLGANAASGLFVPPSPDDYKAASLANETNPKPALGANDASGLFVPPSPESYMAASLAQETGASGGLASSEVATLEVAALDLIHVDLVKLIDVVGGTSKTGSKFAAVGGQKIKAFAEGGGTSADTLALLHADETVLSPGDSSRVLDVLRSFDPRALVASQFVGPTLSPNVRSSGGDPKSRDLHVENININGVQKPVREIARELMTELKKLSPKFAAYSQ